MYLVVHILFLRRIQCHRLTDSQAQARGEGGGVLPYMGYIGMCRCDGYGFQAVYSRIGYINQSVRLGKQLLQDRGDLGSLLYRVAKFSCTSAGIGLRVTPWSQRYILTLKFLKYSPPGLEYWENKTYKLKKSI